MTSRTPFTFQGWLAGARGIAPLAPAVAVYGAAFGVLAQAAGLTAPETVLFSAVVNAGGAQMASLQAWDNPVPILAVGLTTLAMNARYLLLGAALRPWFSGLPPYQSYPSLFMMGDGNWALALREHARGRQDAAFLVGSGMVLWILWVCSTAAGHLFGQALGDPARFGIDFMLAAFFATLAAGFLRQPGSLPPFTVGIVTAIVTERLIAGPWYILVGALIGSLAGAMRHADAD
jgi:predicted branched-subunit amino acid permease